MSTSNLPAGEVKIAKDVVFKILLKKAIRSVLMVVAIAAIVYLAIAATMTRYVATNFGTLKIVSTNFPGGYAPPGTIVLAEPGVDHSSSLISNVKSIFTPHSSTVVVEIVEGPLGNPNWKEFELDREEEDTLNNEYIIKCIAGCEEDTFGIIKADWIMGIPVG